MHARWARNLPSGINEEGGSADVVQTEEDAMQITLEDFSAVIATIHAAATSPERWPEAFTAVARLVNSSEAAEDGDSPRERVMALLAPHFATAKQVQRRLAETSPARPRPDTQSLASRVRGLYGLTQAEARVMAALASGETVDRIAMAHGVRTSTVRAQVRSIFEKTGVNRQSALVRLALTGAPLAAAATNDAETLSLQSGNW